MSASALASRFMRGLAEAPSSLGSGRLMPTTIKSGRAAALRKGVSHLVRAAAIATDDKGAFLATRWECGGGSTNAVPTAAGDQSAACVHCAEAIRYPRGPVVYRCYASDGDLVYIGSSIDLPTRIRAHSRPGGSHWWDEVSRVEVESHATEAAARIAEAKAIAAELPYYNRDGIPPQVLRARFA